MADKSRIWEGYHAGRVYPFTILIPVVASKRWATALANFHEAQELFDRLVRLLERNKKAGG
jgi:hypothetical protein